ncbi:winged helix-turn-helix transcriptional regulator [Pseudochrobactrum kiredjianiae]|uniref:Winged helix-turn-helix transcriptional regulator n=1 Tax=Pseudochrobactrum kiredjianiae TaxID=386305 RepID=A0ABW3V9U8_9HYPH|nr:helix-turn-helix domain-containing protein [Pseudochrobactrum kiredjianiae]MDM7851451.1 helix-turn-helix domain-containing protein [Pseudochrobactrum kiredjianiae]
MTSQAKTAQKKNSATQSDEAEKNTLPLLAETAGFVTDENGTCPIREVLDRVGDTWSLLVILNLQQGTVRFNALRRLVEGISQRMLTVTLRSLERDGLVLRIVRPTSPPEVEYSLTALGMSLAKPIDSLGQWAVDNRHMMREERARFDAQQ